MKIQKIDEQIMMHLISYNIKHNKHTPFGALLTDSDNKIISYGLGYHPTNPAHHAETDAINQCAEKYSDIKWTNLTMYSTGEPCIMCSSACCWVNLKRIVYATDVPFIFSLWHEESNMRCRDIIKASCNKPELTEHVCQKESNEMFLSYKKIYQNLIDHQQATF